MFRLVVTVEFDITVGEGEILAIRIELLKSDEEPNTFRARFFQRDRFFLTALTDEGSLKTTKALFSETTVGRWPENLSFRASSEDEAISKAKAMLAVWPEDI